MDRRIVFPFAVVATAWAQQTSPAAADAEKALRARAEQFYQLELDKKFRQAEAFVAEDTKDLYYRNNKPDIRKFTIDKVELDPDGIHAKVTVMITSVMNVPNMPGMEFTAPVSMTWKLDNGEWCWYQIQDGYIDTPFGKWKVSPSQTGTTPSFPAGMADPSSLKSLIAVDRRTVVVVPGASEAATATITNHLAGDITLQVSGPLPEGLTVSFSKAKVQAGESSVVSFAAAAGTHPAGVVDIRAGAVQDLQIRVESR